MKLRANVTSRIKASLLSRNVCIVNYNAIEHRHEWLRKYEQIKAERPLLLIPTEACQIVSALVATQHIPGDVAEVGVAYGASAKLMLGYAGDRMIHLFDTFEGLPPLAPIDTTSQQSLYRGEFACSLDSVRAYVASDRCRFYPGLFPSTSAPVSNKRFSFVHLDVDLYESTKAGLEFFYPRMSSGGIIISHDYPSLKGVYKAVHEFFDGKQEPVIDLASGEQCLIVKL
jgi:O-methyltransferase